MKKLFLFLSLSMGAILCTAIESHAQTNEKTHYVEADLPPLAVQAIEEFISQLTIAPGYENETTVASYRLIGEHNERGRWGVEIKFVTRVYDDPNWGLFRFPGIAFLVLTGSGKIERSMIKYPYGQ